jgi:pilus assembly protein CpaE
MQNREAAAFVKRAVIISPNLPMAAELEPLLQNQLPGVGVGHLSNYPSPRDLPKTLGTGGGQVAFLDVVSDRDQAAQLLVELGRMGGDLQVVALLDGNDPDLILRCLRAGAVDFLIQPFTADQIESARSKLAKAPAASDAASHETAKVYAVMPAKGACGASTVACNLAFQWRRLGAKRILLADLDPLTGTLSFLLKIRSGSSFLDVLQRAHELDSDLWNAMVSTVQGVDVLLAPEVMVDTTHDLRDPSPILEYAREAYDVVILDGSSVYGEWNLNLARFANELLLVTTNELPALQATQRALSYLDTNRIGRWKIRLIVNRYHRDVGLSREVIGTALHSEVFEVLPADYEAVQKSLMDGKAIAPGTQFGKSIVQLTDRLGGRAEPGKKTSSLGGLLGLFSKTSK